MNIFISADDKFVMPAKVMLTSFFTNNENELHHIYFMYSSVKQENLAELKALVEQYCGVFHPVYMDESDFSGFHTTASFPIMVYFRLMLPHFLPEGEERALWLDVDVIVNGPLDAFYYQDLGGKYIAACRDIGAQNRPALLGCPPDTVYVNSGVMLYDVTAMRRYNISDFKSFYQDHREHILWMDQDIVNGMLSEKIRVWDNDVFNVQALYRPGFPQHDLKRLRSEARIIHYIGPFKPWWGASTCSAGVIWDEYYMMTLGKDAMYSWCYCFYRRLTRWFQRTFIFRLRILHGRIHTRMHARAK